MKQREIKFRAWNGQYMVDSAWGDWVCFDGVPYTEADRKYDTPNNEIQKAKGYVLMQFTGLLDKNGKEIYEGDVVRCVWGNNLPFETPPTFSTETVEFMDGCFDVVSGDTERAPLYVINADCEVIGNIYETPELLNPHEPIDKHPTSK